MRKFLLALGAATLAITVPAVAQPEGKGGGNKGGSPQKAERGGGNKQSGGPVRIDRGNGRIKDQARGSDARPLVKARGNNRIEIARDKDRGDRNVRIVDRGYRMDGAPRIVRSATLFGGGYDNCPPGLAKKDNGCLPPGQAQKLLGARIQQSYANRLIPEQFRRWYRDDDQYLYRYGDDYIYRVSRQNGLVDGLIPLFGGGYYSLGDPWPSSYDFYNVPYQYRSYYGDTGDYRYRYGDGAIYRINSGSGVVEGIVALLAGDLGVGSRLPLGYDTYNVPFAYRDRYVDSADAWYRYNDGYIYQVDPKTRLISAVIDAIV